MWWVAADSTRSVSASNTTMSASEPGAIVPSRVEAEQLGRGGGHQLDEAVQGDLPAADAAVVEQGVAVLDPWQPVGDLGEVADPDLLLVLEMEGAVVGGDEL